MIGRNRVLNLLEGIAEAVLEEIAYLVLGLIEYFLETLEERFNFLPCSVKPFLKHVDGLLLLLVSLIQLRKTTILEEFFSNQFAH